MLVVLAVILLATGAGITAERRLGDAIAPVNAAIIRTIVWVISPPIVFLVVARLDFGGGAGVGLALAWLELLTVGALAWLAAARLLRLSRPQTGTVIVCAIQVNTGYLGLPLVAALLGSGALHAAIAFDSLVTNMVLYTVGYGVGAAFGTRAGQTPRERAVAFLTRNPVLYAAVLGLLAPDTLAPQALVDLATNVARWALPALGFFLLGANLVHEEHGVRLPPLLPAVGLAVALRLVVAPALLIAYAAVVGADVPDAYLLQAAMPVGINALVVSHLYGLDAPLAASAIFWSTLTAVVAALAAYALL